MSDITDDINKNTDGRTMEMFLSNHNCHVREAEEDLLGEQRLFFSDTEEENSPTKKISPRRTKRIIESDEEDYNKQSTSPASTSLIEIDQQVYINFKTNINNIETINTNNSMHCQHEYTRKNKISKIIDSESEDDLQQTKDEHRIVVNKKTTAKTSAIIDSESEDDSRKLHSDLKLFLNSNQDSEENIDSFQGLLDKTKDLELLSKKTQKVKKDKNKNNAQTKISSDSEQNQEFGNEDGETSEKANSSKKRKQMRASAKKALDEMQAIQSEQQRLHREAHLSIPYHKPKRHTLQEFLKRRTIIKPHAADNPMANVIKSKSLKMTYEELEEYAKLMEERAKEATEFFKSESEDEMELRSNSGALDKDALEENVSEETAEDIEETSKGVADIENGQFMSTVSETPEKIVQLPKDEKTPAKPMLLITEVIELPKLDLNNIKCDIDPISIERLALSSIDMSNIKCNLGPISTERLDLPFTNVTRQLTSAPNAMEKIKRLITEKQLSESPSIKGNSNMIIDLETGDMAAKEPTGVDNLLERLIATNKAKKPKSSETVNILSTENGKLEISKVNVSLTGDTNPIHEHKPGAAFFKLKEDLKSLITKKRREELQKKQEDEIEYNKCLDDDDYDNAYDDHEYDIEEYEPESKTEKHQDDVDDELNADVVEYDDEEKVVDNDVEFADKEACETDENDDIDDDEHNEDDDDDDEHNEDDDDDDDDDEHNEGDEDADMDKSVQEDIEENNVSVKSKNRIIKAFANDDSDDNDDIDFLKTQIRASLPFSISAVPLFDTKPDHNNSDEENELMALCSGQIGGDTQMPSSTHNSIISQIPITQMNAEGDQSKDLLELCSGTFDDNAIINCIDSQQAHETQPRTSEIIQQTGLVRNKIVSSDDDDVTAKHVPLDGTQMRKKKLIKRMKKGRARLGFSDDEDEDENSDVAATDIGDGEDTEDIEGQYEVAETFIDYDSEENEILVQMTKKDCQKQAEAYVEKEAELSESDWGSADEDEKNLDRYDVELGDEDEFDREKLSTELGQIHARKMLDEDIREVRKIQELLFDDEEKDGVGRQRQFRWKNAENGFSLDDAHRGGDTANGGHDSADEENEHLWRKIRFEREQILKEQGLSVNSDNLLESTSHLITSTLNSASKITNGICKKFNIITTKNAVNKNAVKQNSPFLISKTAMSIKTSTARGSFLVRDQETLMKLAASLTKGATNAGAAGGGTVVNQLGETAGTVPVNVGKSKNFVFATLTEEEHKNLKRKAEDIMNISTENGINYIKKPKMEPKRDRCLIDQLL